MLPRFDDFSLAVAHIDPVRQNPMLFVIGREEKCLRTTPTLQQKLIHNLFLVPKPHRADKRELLVKQVGREIPADRQPLTHRRVHLPRIGRADIAAC